MKSSQATHPPMKRALPNLSSKRISIFTNIFRSSNQKSKFRLKFDDDIEDSDEEEKEKPDEMDKENTPNG